jgi:type I restriction enzyme S subunit
MASPLRAVLGGYIGGGWGADRQDALHETEAFVIRGTDFEGITRGDTTGVPFRYHKRTNANSRCLEEGDIVFEVSGGSKDQPVGRSLLITAERLRRFPTPVIPASFCKRISPDRTLVDPRFLHAHLQAAWLDRRIVQWQVQSTGISNFKFEEFLDQFKLWLPPLPLQQQIAGVLSAYDELIENSQRRITILESMARALYREWFVHFRSPGHETHPRVASALGAIPQGWAVKEMRQVADVIDCLHSKKPAATPGGPGILLQLHNIGDGGKLDMQDTYAIGAEDYRLWTSRIELVAGDCVVTNVGRVGAVAQIPEGVRAAPGRNMTALRARRGEITPTYLIEYLLSSHMESEIAKKTDLGTIMNSLNVKGIVRLSVPCPPAEVMARYDVVARPLRRRIEVMVQQVQNLRRTRDLLLPRLLSGQIDVEALAS